MEAFSGTDTLFYPLGDHVEYRFNAASLSVSCLSFLLPLFSAAHENIVLVS